METEHEFISTVFVVQNNKVLLNFNNKCKVWVPIGGHIEKNEKPCESVIREAKEESGLDIELVDPYKKFENANMMQPVALRLDHITDTHKHMNLTYFGKIVGGKFREISDDGAPSKWFSKQDLLETEMPDSIRELGLKSLEALKDVE